MKKYLYFGLLLLIFQANAMEVAEKEVTKYFSCKLNNEAQVKSFNTKIRALSYNEFNTDCFRNDISKILKEIRENSPAFDFECKTTISYQKQKNIKPQITEWFFKVPNSSEQEAEYITNGIISAQNTTMCPHNTLQMLFEIIKTARTLYESIGENLKGSEHIAQIQITDEPEEEESAPRIDSLQFRQQVNQQLRKIHYSKKGNKEIQYKKYIANNEFLDLVEDHANAEIKAGKLQQEINLDELIKQFEKLHNES